ncbi:MAG: hypothetical protein ACO3GW_05010 [Vulcanococcus sp.]
MPRAQRTSQLRQRLNVIWIATGFQLLGAVALANPNGVPALYDTKAEAEAAAKKHFNCTGAHQMGNQWMPCDKHAENSGSTHTH